MPLKFTQMFEDLKAVLVDLDSTGEWVDLNQNQKQFRQASGAIMNWFPSTGTISFQGKSAAAAELEKNRWSPPKSRTYRATSGRTS